MKEWTISSVHEAMKKVNLLVWNWCSIIWNGLKNMTANCTALF